MPNDWVFVNPCMGSSLSLLIGKYCVNMWNFIGKNKPPFAIAPKNGQESVWDYPRPPALRQDSRTITIIVNEKKIIETNNSVKVMETASPPTFYIPRIAIDKAYLHPSGKTTYCEWKGEATYYDLIIDKEVNRMICWSYEAPKTNFFAIKDFLGFYPSMADCYIDDEKVKPQGGGFYGGWITREVVGPFKGDPETGSW